MNASEIARMGAVDNVFDPLWILLAELDEAVPEGTEALRLAVRLREELTAARRKLIGQEDTEQEMQYNVCASCGAKDGRAGLLINGECLNCYDSTADEMVLHLGLERTDEEIRRMVKAKKGKARSSG